MEFDHVDVYRTAVAAFCPMNGLLKCQRQSVVLYFSLSCLPCCIGSDWCDRPLIEL